LLSWDDGRICGELKADFRLTDYVLWGDWNCSAFEVRLIAANAVSWMGVSTPDERPILETAPLRSSISVGSPASRSRSKLGLFVSGSESQNSRMREISLSARAKSRARPTANTSAIARASNKRSKRIARMGPIGDRVNPQAAATGARKANFRQRSRRMLLETCVSTPAPRKTSARSSTRSLRARACA